MTGIGGNGWAGVDLEVDAVDIRESVGVPGDEGEGLGRAGEGLAGVPGHNGWRAGAT